MPSFRLRCAVWAVQESTNNIHTDIILNYIFQYNDSGLITIKKVPTIDSIHARAIIGRKRGLAGIGTKLVGVKLLNTLQQVSKLTSTN